MQAAALPGYVWEPDRKHKSWCELLFGRSSLVHRRDNLPLVDVINDFRSLRNVCAREMCRLITAVSDGEGGRRKAATSLEKVPLSRHGHGHALRRTTSSLARECSRRAQNRISASRARPLFFLVTHTFITKRTA
jgi:hypothetical protein